MINKFEMLVTESLSATATDSGIKVGGLALPLEKVSRNGFKYITESIQQAHPTLQGTPVLFNHDSDKVIGHVVTVGMSEFGLTYEMNLDTDGPYGWVAKKVARGDLTKVSIQAAYDVDKSFIDENGATNAWVDEFFELSVVSIPGFKDTTASVVEAVRNKREGGFIMADTEEPKTETSDDMTKYDERLASLEAKVAELKAAFEKAKESEEEEPKDKVEEAEKDDEAEEAEDEEEDEEDKEKKVAEAIRKDKITIANETIQVEASAKPLTKKELKEMFANMR